MLGGMAETDAPDVAVIGGSGFYTFLEDPREIEVETPYGKPSAPIAIGTVGDVVAIGAVGAVRTIGTVGAVRTVGAIVAGAGIALHRPAARTGDRRRRRGAACD